jgi:hypothetical protein
MADVIIVRRESPDRRNSSSSGDGVLADFESTILISAYFGGGGHDRHGEKIL